MLNTVIVLSHQKDPAAFRRLFVNDRIRANIKELLGKFFSDTKGKIHEAIVAMDRKQVKKSAR